MAQQTDIKYLTPIAVDIRKKKYCRFKKSGIKYIDYKDGEFEEIRERTRQNPAQTFDRNFIEISEKSSSGSKKSQTPCFTPVRY